MVIKKIAYLSTLVGLSSLLSLTLSVSTGLASPALEATNFSKEDSSDSTLRQGLPGRRLGGGTRGDRVFSDAMRIWLL